MSKLERLSALRVSVAEREFENEFVSLQDERFVGLAKITARTFPPDEEREILRILQIEDDLEPHRVLHGSLSIAWVSPQERLLIGDQDAMANLLDELIAAMSVTALPVPLDHQCVAMRLTGDHARQILASLTPKDFHPGTFRVDSCTRTSFGECGVFVQRLVGDSDFRLIFDQSYAVYAWRMLEDACKSAKASTLVGRTTDG